MAPRQLREVALGTQSTEGGVGPNVVVVVALILSEPAGVPEALEALLVQKLISKPPVEALCVRVLNRLPWANEVVLDIVAVAPDVEGDARELRSVSVTIARGLP